MVTLNRQAATHWSHSWPDWANLLLGLWMLAAPFLLGFILGPMMDENLRRALLLSHGDFGVFVTRPISATLLALAAVLLLLTIAPAVRRTREEAFAQ